MTSCNEALEKELKFLELFRRSISPKSEELESVKQELNLAPTPREPILTQSSVTLFRYTPLKKRLHHTPLLIIPSLILRYHIMDLMKGHSLIEHLVNKGIDTYLIDWVAPGEETGDLTFDYYIDTFIGRCIRKVSMLNGKRPINLLGQCIGGLLGIIYSALYPEHINKFIALTTPVDFQDAGLLALWTRKEYFDVDAVVNTYGFLVPPEFIHACFPLLNVKATMEKYKRLYNNVLDENFLHNFRAIDQWANDSIPFPAKVFKKFIQDLYQDNLLVKNAFTINGRKVCLSNITSPVLSITAEFDHVFPEKSAKTLLDHLKCSWRYEMISAGHVTIIVLFPQRHQTYDIITEFILR